MSRQQFQIRVATENAQALCNFIDGLGDIQVLVVPSMHDQSYGVCLDTEVWIECGANYGDSKKFHTTIILAMLPAGWFRISVCRCLVSRAIEV